jgi:hypothetical protein
MTYYDNMIKMRDKATGITFKYVTKPSPFCLPVALFTYSFIRGCFVSGSCAIPGNISKPRALKESQQEFRKNTSMKLNKE